jgi:hypothetical protein
VRINWLECTLHILKLLSLSGVLLIAHLDHDHQEGCRQLGRLNSECMDRRSQSHLSLAGASIVERRHSSGGGGGGW